MHRSPLSHDSNTGQPSPRRDRCSNTDDDGVLLTATELFVSRNVHPIEDKKIFLELARNLLPTTRLRDRRRISKLLAVHPEIPASLHAQLATDPDELTAYPALRYSQSLSVDLLKNIARAGPDTLRMALINRAGLDDSILSELCENAGPDLIRALLKRKDVLLKEAHQSKLSRRVDIVAELGPDLASQDILNPDGLIGQYPHLPQELRAKAVAAAEMTNLVKTAQSPGAQPIRRLNTSLLRLHKALTQTARAGQPGDFTNLISHGLGLSASFCDLITSRDQADSLTIALKSLELSRRDTATILIRLFGKNVPLSAIKDQLRLHANISAGAAKVMTSQWLLHEGLPEAGSQAQPQYQEAVYRLERKEPIQKRSLARGAAGLPKSA